MLERVGSLWVVRDDLVAGGTKRRALPALLASVPAGVPVVYASPAYGYAQVALAHECAASGRRAVVFVARRARPHPRTLEAVAAGARVVQVPHGYLSHVQAVARRYADEVGGFLLPFGLDLPVVVDALAEAAAGLRLVPDEVWTVAGSGTLSRALQRAWPGASFHAVRVGAVPAAGRARLWRAPEAFEADAKVPPPFPSCSNYDAKAWRFLRSEASPGALFWNVAA